MGNISDNVATDEIYDDTYQYIVSGYCNQYCKLRGNRILDNYHLYRLDLIQTYYHQQGEINQIREGSCLSYGTCLRDAIKIDHRILDDRHSGYSLFRHKRRDEFFIKVALVVVSLYASIIALGNVCRNFLMVAPFICMVIIIMVYFPSTIIICKRLWVFLKSNLSITYSYSIIRLNQNTEMLQKWEIEPIELKAHESNLLLDPTKPGYICRIHTIKDICKFSDLKSITYTRPSRINGESSDGSLTFTSNNLWISNNKFLQKIGLAAICNYVVPERNSYNLRFGYQWDGILTQIQNVMNKTNCSRYNQIKIIRR